MGNTVATAARPPRSPVAAARPAAPAAVPAKPTSTVAAAAKPASTPAAAAKPAAPPAGSGYSLASSFTPGATAASAPAPKPGTPEDIGPDGDDDTKKSKYYDPARNQPKLSSRENRVFQQPNIPQKLKDALIKDGKTITEIMEDGELSKLYAALPKGSDASARATGLACSNLVRANIRRSWMMEVNASALKIHI